MKQDEMDHDVWRILLIDDDKDDYLLTNTMLSDVRRGRYDLTWKPSYEEAQKILCLDHFDVILIDYSLGSISGVDLIREFSGAGCQTPIIMLTGQGSYEVDVEAMQAGAYDYLSKREVNASLLERTIRYAIERSRSEQALEEANQKLRQERSRLNAFIENALAGILFTDREGNFILANPATRAIFDTGVTGTAEGPVGGYTLHRLDGTPFPQDELPLQQALLKGESTRNIEMMVRNANGREVSLTINTSPVYDAAGKIDGAVAIMQDITERKQSERERTRLSEQMEVQQRLLEHREMERQQIARDLHDGPVQDLIGLLFTTQSLMEQSTDELTHNLLVEIRGHVERMVDELRAFFKELRPPALVKFGLEKAIHSHADEFMSRHPETTIQLQLAEDGDHLPSGVRLALFRIYQESLINATRHARPKLVKVIFTYNKDYVELEIQDNGRGFRNPIDWVALARRGHLGLVSMKERAEAVGGTLTIHSSVDEGTRVNVKVPAQGRG